MLIILQNYQSTFYQTSGETEVEDDEEKLLPLAINVHPSSVSAHRGARNGFSNSATSTAAIFPRSTPLSPASYQTSPWLRTLPSQSVRSATSSGVPPPRPVGSSTPAAASPHTAKNTKSSHPWTLALSVHVSIDIVTLVLIIIIIVCVCVCVCVCFNYLWPETNDQCTMYG